MMTWLYSILRLSWNLKSLAVAGEGGSVASFDLRLRTRRALRKKPSKRRENPVERALIERAEVLRKGAAPVE